MGKETEMTIDLGKMTHKELEAHLEDVKKAIKSAYERDRTEARKAAEKAVAEYGFSLDEVSGGGSGKKSKASLASAKYQNPSDKSQTWTGKGRQPNWYRDMIAKGVSPDDLLI